MVTSFGRSCLHAAAARDQVRIVSLILTCGANLFHTDQFGNSPLDVAMLHDSYTCHRILKVAQRKNLARRGEQGLTMNMQSDVNGCNQPRDTNFQRLQAESVPYSESEYQQNGGDGHVLQMTNATNSSVPSSTLPSLHPDHTLGKDTDLGLQNGQADLKKRSKSAPYYQTKYHIMAKQPRVYRGR